MKSEVKVTADPFVASIVTLMPESTRYSMWKRLGEIIDYAARPRGNAPTNMLGFDAVQMGIKGITMGGMTFKRQKDQSYRLKAIVTIGSYEQEVLRLQSERAEILVELPESVSNIKSAMPLRQIVDYALLDDFEVRRIDGKVLYLKGPQGAEDVTSLLQHASSARQEDAMSLARFLEHVRETGQCEVDRILMEFLKRIERAKKLDIAWERIERAMAVGITYLDISDLLYLDNGATLALRLYVPADKPDTYGPQRLKLGMKYSSENLSYADGTLHWCGSYKRNWGSCEQGCFVSMPWRRNGQGYSKSLRKTKSINLMLKAEAAGERWWYS